MSVSKNKAPATTDKSKGIDLLSKAALLEEAQVKKVLTRSQQEITIHQAGSSGDGTGSKPGVLDEPKGKSVDTNKGTGDSGDEANVQGDDEDFQDSDDEPHQADDERTYSENQETNDDEKESDDEFEHTPLNYVLADDEINDESKEVDKEEYDRIEKELYGDVNVRLTDVEQDDEDEEGAHMTDDVHVQVEQTQEQTTGIQEESGPEMASVQGQYVVQATTTSILAIYNAITEMTTPTPIPTTEPTTSSIPTISNFASLFRFDQRVSALEQDLPQANKLDHYCHSSSYTEEFEKKAQVEKEKYIDIIKKLVKEIIKDEVKSQLTQILPKEISDFATPMIQTTINESLNNQVEGPPAGSDQGLKKRKTRKDAEPSRGFKSTESKSSSSKGSKSQSKSFGKSAQAEEPMFEIADTEMTQDQGDNMGNTKDQPNVEEASKHDWFKKPERSPTPDRDWNDGKQIDFGPPRTWINKMEKTGKPPTTFDELMSTPIDFSAHVVTDKLDWHNPEGHEYPFYLSKPLPLIEYQGRQVVPANYFFNNDLEYLKGGSSSGKYTTSTTKTKAAKYDNIDEIEDMVQQAVSSPMVAAAKLPVLNPVIVNGDSPPPKRTVDGVEQTYPPTIAEEKLARKNELKARGTLLMTLPNEHQLKFNTYKCAQDSDRSYREKVWRVIKLKPKFTKCGFCDGVSAANYKNNASTLPNVNSLSDAMIYSFFASRSNSSQLDNEDLKTPRNQDSRNREITRRTMPVEETTSNALVSQCDGFGYDWSDQAKEGPTNFTLMAYTSLGSLSSSSSDTEILKLDIMLRDNALTELRKKFEKAKKERDDLKLTLEKFENSSKNLSKLLDSQVSDKFKTGVGYDSQVFDSQVNDKYKTSEGYHVVPPPYTGNFMPPKPDLVLADKDEYVFSESVTSVPAVATSEVKTSEVKTSEFKTSESKPKSVSEPLIEDWISDSENENETKLKSRQRKPNNAKVKFIKSNKHVKSPRESVKKVENNKQAEYPRKNSQSPR
ncbi:hypothetical protein Tco_0589981, partial [Tanacetum coccineum]